MDELVGSAVPSETPVDSSVARVTKVTLDLWARQGSQSPVDATRVALSDLIIAVGPLLSVPGYVTEAASLNTRCRTTGLRGSRAYQPR
jgi:hypothetical protein